MSDNYNTVCPECGDMFTKISSNNNYCQACQYWTDIIAAMKKNKNMIIADGHVYVINTDESEPARLRGYSGRQFTFRKPDGTIIISCNVWNGTKISDRFRDRLPDTTTIMKSEPYSCVVCNKSTGRFQALDGHYYCPEHYKEFNHEHWGSTFDASNKEMTTVTPKPVDVLFPQAAKDKAKGVCPTCGNDINHDDFKDDLSHNEFMISGLCQKCQDDFFGV